MGVALPGDRHAGRLSRPAVAPVIGLAWLMHACWDLPHHLWGNPIWPFMPTSSFGCMIFDALIAIWFLAGAPSLIALGSPARAGIERAARL